MHWNILQFDLYARNTLINKEEGDGTMKKYRKPTMETIRISNDVILAAWSARDDFNSDDVSYAKRKNFLLEDEED